MLSVKTLSTLNFSFTITDSSDATGMCLVTIKPTTKTGKDLFRFKKWGKEQTMVTDKNSIFVDVNEYEDKLAKLAAI